MWFYEQSLREYNDPKTAVRAKADFRPGQRRRRMESMKWFGFSNFRPRPAAIRSTTIIHQLGRDARLLSVAMERREPAVEGLCGSGSYAAAAVVRARHCTRNASLVRRRP